MKIFASIFVKELFHSVTRVTAFTQKKQKMVASGWVK